jgi:DNA-binding LytR/AlgR family response regulator
MIRIAICDDNKDELAMLAGLVREYMEDRDLDIRISEFSHPDQLLAVCEKEVFHVYVLDIVMPLVDGIELGSKIRKLDRETQIIFATTEPQYALRAYRANPLDYLVKPIQRQQLFDVLGNAVERINSSDEPVFPVKMVNGIKVIRIRNILCCEYTNHQVWFSLVNGEKVKSSTINGKFTGYMSEVLADTHFLQPHASYIVNMRYVERFDKDAFTMRGGIRIPISARSYREVRDIYMDYLMGEERI